MKNIYSNSIPFELTLDADLPQNTPLAKIVQSALLIVIL